MVLSAVFVCDIKDEKKTAYASSETDYETHSLEESFDFEYGDDGYYVSGYKGDQRNIEIPDYYNGEKVLGITDAPYGKKGVFEGNKDIISVKMGSNSVSIGKRAFYGCENLESFEFCDGIEYVGRYAFYGCSSLNEISLPSSVNYVGWYAFVGTAWYENAIAEAKEKDYESSTLIIKINHVLLDVIKVYDGKLELKNEDGISVLAEYALLNGNRKNITEIKEVIIPSSVKYINGYCFGWEEGYKEQSEVTSLKIEGDVIVGEKAFGSITNSFNGKNSVKFGYEKGVHYVGERVSSFSDNVVKENYVTDDNTVIEDCVVIKDGTVEISDGAFALKRAVDGKYSTEYRDNKLIKNVVIPASCKRIGKNAFAQCVNLERVIYLGDGLTVDENAFAYCENLVEFEGIDKVKSIGYSCFYGCKKLEKVTLVSCKIGAEAFKDCSSLVLALGNNCEIKRDAFLFCDKVPACVVSKDGNEYYYLGQEQGQTELKVNVANVYVAEYAFKNSNITTVDVKADKITIGKGAFEFCEQLTSFSVNQPIELVDLIFYGDKKLASLNLLPTGVGGYSLAYTQVSNVDFSNAEYFSDYALTDSKISSVSVIGVQGNSISSYAFFKAENLNEIIGENNEYYSIENGVLYNNDKTVLLTYPVKKSGEINLPSTINKIGDCAFSFVDFGENALEFGVESIGKNAFYEAKAKSVKIINTGNLVIDEKAFYKAEIESFSYGEENEQKNGTVKYKAFAYSSLKSVDLSVAKCEPFIFKGCYLLKNVTFAFKNDLYANFGYLFGNDYFNGSTPYVQSKTNEKRVKYYMPAVENVTVKGEKLGMGAFMAMDSLKKATLTEGIGKIGSKAFVSCESLKEVIIPSTVKTIGSQAFNSCKALTEIELPSSVYVGSTAFAYCESLNTVTLKGNAYFENSVFSFCKNLKTVNLTQELSASDNAYGLLFEYTDTVTLNGVAVPDEKVREWKEIVAKKQAKGLNKAQKVSLTVLVITIILLIAYFVWMFALKKKERYNNARNVHHHSVRHNSNGSGHKRSNRSKK